MGFWSDEEFDAESLSGLTTDEPPVLQFDNHAMHTRRCDLEEPLHIGLRRRSAVQRAVGIDECEVLALFFSKPMLHGIDKPLQMILFRLDKL
jgi:hypothetical protein